MLLWLLTTFVVSIFWVFLIAFRYTTNKNSRNIVKHILTYLIFKTVFYLYTTGVLLFPFRGFIYPLCLKDGVNNQAFTKCKNSEDYLRMCNVSLPLIFLIKLENKETLNFYRYIRHAKNKDVCLPKIKIMVLNIVFVRICA